jgi:hypothetical protein
VGSQNSNQTEQMLWLQVAAYLGDVRDALVETVIVLEDSLFELDAMRRHVAEEVSQEVLKQASR